ncbi:IS66 family insertion sequence element accessory protein TnpB [Marinomonas mediterranea]|uniref:IS66 family insertion sequence element accessory protein TnpB n=1 Tax=Marinomonas mediterranea TaxID=119864 RepID=UPI0030910161|nr:IS66 family insertion sequence element accessory protein TnpB [Marinomonas mediterranea]
MDTLFGTVPYDLEQEPCSEHLFVFCGRTRNKLKISQWSANGFWLHYKRLEKSTFKWPGIEDNKLSIRISARTPYKQLIDTETSLKPPSRYC